MPSTVAVAHYPEGAGHATRILAVAEALESSGAAVRMAGGGAGTEFVALNGYDEFEPTTVDYLDTYQGGSTWQVVSQSLPASLGRIADYRRGWRRPTRTRWSPTTCSRRWRRPAVTCRCTS
jgi:UDP:flavonoid glycosyltransferase YjiC (YdhE family)